MPLDATIFQGVTRHVGEALGEEVHVRGSKIVALGIAPWGVVQQRNMLIGIDHTCQYHAQGTLAGRQETALNPHHNYFLLADNGTSGKFSTAEICLRRRLEQYLAQQPIGLRRLVRHPAVEMKVVISLSRLRFPLPQLQWDDERQNTLVKYAHSTWVGLGGYRHALEASPSNEGAVARHLRGPFSKTKYSSVTGILIQNSVLLHNFVTVYNTVTAINVYENHLTSRGMHKDCV
ncbi:Transient receptor potential channel [Taenia solium]|eukprot:TsM_000889700 transcript=TsM_000889700 gene=TsM_000889700